MAKPSIFSKNYEQKMRRRRKRIIFTIFVAIIAVIFAAATMRGIFKSSNKDSSKTKENITSEKNTSNKEAQPSIQTKEEKPESYSVQVSNGTTVNAIYDIKDNEKTFKYISPTESNMEYSISPSGKSMVLFDDKAQSIIFIDINGNKQDVTNPQYTATDGTVITKGDQLSKDPSYIWCSSPKFINDENIAYISQLPWLGKTTKYIWIENINSKTHSLVQQIQGEDLKFDKLTDKGLTVIADGRTVFLAADGSISE